MALERAILSQDPAIAAPPRRGSLADLRTRRRGALAIAFGGGLLLAAAVAAILAGGDGIPISRANTLAVIDPESGDVVDTIPTGVQPVAVAADGTDVWVANAVDDNLHSDRRGRARGGRHGAGRSQRRWHRGRRRFSLGREQPRLEADRLDPTLGARQTTRLAALPEFSS